MTLYFFCLLEWTELLIDIYSLAFLLFFSEMAMTNWLQHLVYSRYIFWIFLFLNLSAISTVTQIFPHTLFPVVCDSVPFTLLNITDNSVVINKPNEGKPLDVQESVSCGLWGAWYHVYLFYGRL